MNQKIKDALQNLINEGLSFGGVPDVEQILKTIEKAGGVIACNMCDVTPCIKCMEYEE